MQQDKIDDVLDRFEHHNHEEADLFAQRRDILSREYAHDVENDPIELEAVRERQQLLWFGLNRAQKQELNIAFRIVSGGKDSIPASKVFDVIQAIGITLLPEQIKLILSNCLKDKNGRYNYPSLETAINKHLASMVQVRVLRGIYEILKSSGMLPNRIDEIEGKAMDKLQRATALKLKSELESHQYDRVNISKSCIDVLKSLFSQDMNVIDSSDDEAISEGISWKEMSVFLNNIMSTMNEENSISKDEICDVIAEISSRRNDEISFFDFVGLFRT